jgi:hypothetical protein
MPRWARANAAPRRNISSASSATAMDVDENGGQGLKRTTDTRIFNPPVLHPGAPSVTQNSHLGEISQSVDDGRWSWVDAGLETKVATGIRESLRGPANDVRE